jgi:hypothetical protein
MAESSYAANKWVSNSSENRKINSSPVKIKNEKVSPSTKLASLDEIQPKKSVSPTPT